MKKRNSAVLRVSSLAVTSIPHAIEKGLILSCASSNQVTHHQHKVTNDGKMEMKQRKENSMSTGIS